MRITDFGAIRPQVQPYQGGYSVPAGLRLIERSTGDGEPVQRSWRGYLLQVPCLTALELDRAIATLPPGDYTEARKEALLMAVLEQRRSEYPPIAMYLDGVVKGDDAQVAAYKAACLAVKQRNPLP